MQNIEPLLSIRDIMTIFGISQPTVYRWIALARQGTSRFPLPVGDTKQKLRWSPDAIRTFQNANTPVPKIESATQRTKRTNAAMDRLRSKGVNVSRRDSQ